MKITKILSIIIVSTTLSACASIFSPAKQPVKIISTPEGATATVAGQTVTTPAIVDLKGKSEYLVTVEKEGYENKSAVIDSKIRIVPAVIGNILNLSFAIGMAIDFFATGTGFDLDNEVIVNLEKK